MCRLRLTRRRALVLGGVGGASLLAGCDERPEIDLVSDETVEAMGLEAWREVRRDVPVTRRAELQEALDAVSARLLSAAGEARGDWEVLVFASPEVNAFALPGRMIGVYEGMFGVAAGADLLAAVVGHEIGHLRAEHGQERMNAQVAKRWGLRLLAFLLDMGDVEYAGEIAAALGLGVEYGLVLPYSRRQELEADRLGLALMADAGFEPAAAVTLWQRMDATFGSRPPAFLATHPAPDTRIAEIREMLPSLR